MLLGYGNTWHLEGTRSPSETRMGAGGRNEGLCVPGQVRPTMAGATQAMLWPRFILGEDSPGRSHRHGNNRCISLSKG